MIHRGCFGFLLYLSIQVFRFRKILESPFHTTTHQIAHQIENMHTMELKRISFERIRQNRSRYIQDGAKKRPGLFTFWFHRKYCAINNIFDFGFVIYGIFQ